MNSVTATKACGALYSLIHEANSSHEPIQITSKRGNAVLISEGAASARFHRPSSGIGLSEFAKAHLRSARLFLDEFNIVKAQPDANHDLLFRRQDNEAYVTRIEGKQYAAYFTKGGEVALEIPSKSEEWEVRWLDVGRSEWRNGGKIGARDRVVLKTPGQGHWVALVKVAN